MKKNKQYKRNLLILGIIFLICLCLIYLSRTKISQIRNSYDYESISEIIGIVEDIGISNNKFYLDITLPNGDEMTIFEGNKLKSSIGDEVKLYTNGEYYGISQEDVLQKNTNIYSYYFMNFISIFGCVLCVFFFLMESTSFLLFKIDNFYCKKT